MCDRRPGCVGVSGVAALGIVGSGRRRGEGDGAGNSAITSTSNENFRCPRSLLFPQVCTHLTLTQSFCLLLKYVYFVTDDNVLTKALIFDSAFVNSISIIR